jgi:hypothetical protein
VFRTPEQLAARAEAEAQASIQRDAARSDQYSGMTLARSRERRKG